MHGKFQYCEVRKVGYEEQKKITASKSHSCIQFGRCSHATHYSFRLTTTNRHERWANDFKVSRNSSVFELRRLFTSLGHLSTAGARVLQVTLYNWNGRSCVLFSFQLVAVKIWVPADPRRKIEASIESFISTLIRSSNHFGEQTHVRWF